MATASFDGPDAGSLPSPWVTVQNGPVATIVSNVAACSTTAQEGCAIWDGDETFTADQVAEVVIAAIGVDSYMGPAVRGDPAGPDYYGFYADSGNQFLVRVDGGTYTALASRSVTTSVNDILRLEVEGTTLRAYVNGTLWTSLTDSAIANGTPGILSWGNNNSTRVNDWVGNSLDNVTLTPSPATAPATAPAPTLVLGSVSISPAHAPAVATAPAPTVLAGGAPQYARPASDVSIGAWTTDTGSTSNLYAAIDETTASDADFIRSELSPSASVCTIALGSLTDPVSSSGHIVRYRYGKDPADSAQIDLTVRLRQGASTIATWTHTDISTTLATAEQTLSGAEADSITDYADLRIQFEASQV